MRSCTNFRQRLLVVVAFAPLLAVGLAGCGQQKPKPEIQITQLKKGQGPAIKKDQVAQVIYTGFLAKNGSKFDSNMNEEPIEFIVGAGQMIQGFDQGVQGMRVGEKRKILIPPELGYGERGYGQMVPGGSKLMFEVELVGITDKLSPPKFNDSKKTTKKSTTKKPSKT